MKDMEFKDKVAIVTGAGRGIGEAISKALSQKGVKLYISDIDPEAALNTAAQLPDTASVKCDVTSLEDCEKLVDLTLKKYGRLDYLISNAGILKSGAVEEIDPGDWYDVINVNLIGTFNMVRAVAPYMKENRRGSIVSINSKSGKKGSYKSSAYAASKFGALGFVQSMALEFADYQVRINAICPGNLMDSPLWTGSLNEQYARNRGISKEECRAIYDKQVPLGRTCNYDDVTNAMFFLLSDDSCYITGQAINVTGGMEMR